jgi:hypothetical protein
MKTVKIHIIFALIFVGLLLFLQINYFGILLDHILSVKRIMVYGRLIKRRKKKFSSKL